MLPSCAENEFLLYLVYNDNKSILTHQYKTQVFWSLLVSVFVLVFSWYNQKLKTEVVIKKCFCFWFWCFLKVNANGGTAHHDFYEQICFYLISFYLSYLIKVWFINIWMWFVSRNSCSCGLCKLSQTLILLKKHNHITETEFDKISFDIIINTWGSCYSVVFLYIRLTSKKASTYKNKSIIIRMWFQIHSKIHIMFCIFSYWKKIHKIFLWISCVVLFSDISFLFNLYE